MIDLTIISNCHQRYQNDTPIFGTQYCKRAIIVQNTDFADLIKGLQTTPSEGYLVRMINMDINQDQMQPKPMVLVADNGDSILLRGATFKFMGVPVPGVDFKDYGLELVLRNRKVIKCILYMYDRDTRIEYCDIQ